MTSPVRRRHVPRVAEPLRHIEPEFVESPAGRIAAWRLGEDPAVLLVHGFEDDNALWTPLIDMLTARGRSVLVFDLPGHGLSDEIDDAAPAAPDAVAAVARALGPIDAIVGHSLGGWAAAQAVANGLDVRRLVLIGAPFESGPERWRRAARRFGLSEDLADEALSRWLVRRGPERWPELSDALRRIATPTLVIHSRDDERACFDAAERECAGLGHAHMIDLSDVGHRESAQHPEAIAAATFFCDAD